MSNRIKNFMDEWKYNDEALKSFSGNNVKAPNDRQYLKEKLSNTAAFINANKNGLTKEEKAWLVILKTGHKHLERKLYPNRFVRYVRRAFIAIGKAINAQRERQMSRSSDPAPDFTRYADNNKPSVKANAEKKAQAAAKATILRMPVKNKYEAVKGIKQSKGRSL